MNDVMGTIRNMIWNLTHRIRIVDLIDIILVAVIIYELLLLTRHTRGSALLKGLVLLVAIALICSLFVFVSLNCGKHSNVWDEAGYSKRAAPKQKGKRKTSLSPNSCRPSRI